MPSPFRKKQYMSSSERTKNLSNRTMTNIANKQLIIDSNLNNYKTMNHNKRLNYTKGYYLLNGCCEDKKTVVKTIQQGKFSVLDMDNVIQNHSYIIDKKRHLKGLITPRGKLDPTPTQQLFRYPIQIPVFRCINSNKKTCGPCDTHFDQQEHTHYYTTNLNNKATYTHNHTTNPHPDPKPFPNNNDTINFMAKTDLNDNLTNP